MQPMQPSKQPAPPSQETLRCRHCGAHENGEIRAMAEALTHCNNCRVDIHLKGHWTQIGYPILQSLIQRYGQGLVSAEIHRAKEIQTRRTNAPSLPETPK